MTTLKYLSQLLMKFLMLLVMTTFFGVTTFVIGTFIITKGFEKDSTDPSILSSRLIKKDTYKVTNTIKRDLKKNNIWLMVLNNQGDIIESYELPKKLKKHYQLTDIAKSAKWYLDDSPIFTYVVGDNLVILGYPQNTYAKFPANYYQIKILFNEVYFLIILLLIQLFIYFWVYSKMQLNVRKEFLPITKGLENLSNHRETLLDESGNLSEIKKAINQSSQLLSESHEMRSHWIRGVSHDLRNPLTLILGYTGKMKMELGEMMLIQRINEQVYHMESIISNLNLSYLLDSNEVDEKWENINFSALLRNVIVDFLNNYPDIQLEFELPTDDAFCKGDQILLKRSIDNLILNSINHNTDPKIKVLLSNNMDDIELTISDNGSITKNKVNELRNKTRQYGIHGMGTVISKQIINLHNGSINYFFNDPGLKIVIILPKYRG
ncbi:sensor histidine kinase [Streptococcus parauberis]|uniref:sensor histidine kinase n=1 Tax=Streptococcus parauberis TaxID=1348 RepID=UPI000E30AFDA|nr:HAMP domain-containing sensor histidine kinase [Streptococcus parauberis]RFE01452.1 putative sensor histidine kinase TcrY [Streptococcus parauberis]